MNLRPDELRLKEILDNEARLCAERDTWKRRADELALKVDRLNYEIGGVSKLLYRWKLACLLAAERLNDENLIDNNDEAILSAMRSGSLEGLEEAVK